MVIKQFSKWMGIASLVLACNVHDPQKDVPELTFAQAERNVDRIMMGYCSDYERDGSNLTCMIEDCESARYVVYLPSEECAHKSTSYLCVDKVDPYYKCDISLERKIAIDLSKSNEVQLFPHEIYFHVVVDNSKKSPTATIIHHNLSEARTLTDSLYVLMQKYHQEDLVNSNIKKGDLNGI
jgi:hypothetical protein